MRAIVDKHIDAHLVIVGRGTEVLQPMIKELGLEQSITLTGAVAPIELNPNTKDVVGALYRESELYIAPGMSEGSEGLSLALLDAMAAGSSIVATDISGNRDLIRDRKNGLLVAPGEPQAISAGAIHLLADKELQKACKAQALQDVQPYSWVSIAEQYVETYRAAIVMSRQQKVGVKAA
jgi:glycosyltransferase involved in cell wall biosynthesis